MLIPRIYGVCLLLCPICGEQMSTTSITMHRADIWKMLEHIGVAEPLRITPARGPPLWGACNAQMGDGLVVASDGVELAQPIPDFEVDQRVSGSRGPQGFCQRCEESLRRSPTETGHTEKSRVSAPEQEPKSDQ